MFAIFPTWLGTTNLPDAVDLPDVFPLAIRKMLHMMISQKKGPVICDCETLHLFSGFNDPPVKTGRIP